MLRENGIPQNGQGKGRNLNNEILNSFQRSIEEWHLTMEAKIESISSRLLDPVQSVLEQLRGHLDNNEIHFQLKTRADVALNTATSRIRAAFEVLKTNLKAKLQETYSLYTTEVNVKCPVAVEMKPIYHSALAMRGGRGAYKKTRDELTRRLVVGDGEHNTLPDIMAKKIVTTQKDVWLLCCQGFVNEVINQLRDFRQTTDESVRSLREEKRCHIV